MPRRRKSAFFTFWTFIKRTSKSIMAVQEADKKRKRNRKAHTDEASSASSSSESESISSPLGNQNGNEQQQSSTADVDDSSHSDTAETNGQEPIVAPQPKKSDPEQAFDELYLKQATKEFANDLDKLRSASDFNERSVPMLIEALRQGRACFTAEESRRIGQAGLSGGDGL